MGYWSYHKPQSVEEVTSYENMWGQLVSIEDRVSWPTWRADISSGTVIGIKKLTFEKPMWQTTMNNEGYQSEFKFQLKVKKEYATVIIHYGLRVFKVIT